MECPNCGGINSDDAFFCSKCGAQLSAAPPASPGSDQPQGPQEWVAQEPGGAYGVEPPKTGPYTPPPMAYGQTPPMPGQPVGGYYGGMRPNIPNHLVWAVLTTLFCCLPAGVVSIVYAAQVNGKIESGDYATAQRYSDRARTWAIVSAVLVVVYIAIIVMFVLSVSVSSS